ncbi:dipeptide ABC transporter ATP-binding protein [Agrobacterium vitis]|uniref:dipeptide ABC transporter ATP-binding protein n=1 Tax=Agrobacterium vitis TaxID=373 RepID=UPI001F420FC7|nr:ABC transporter ATP-binding protein [Agrobacterium vitis]MCE6076461.1 dipeptide ABC transporter ATP-binding protein [Agrobacterium vitis]
MAPHIDQFGQPVSSEALLEIDRLSFRYGHGRQGIPTLDNVSLTVAKGEVVALVGESGSGKSTLINCVIGLHSVRDVHIEARTLRFKESDLRSLSPKSWRKLRGRHIGYVSQDPSGSLNPLVTVGEQLCEALRVFRPELGRAQAKSLVLDQMRKVGFTEPQHVYDRYPHQLSGGMNQRISIAAALSGEPELLLADEPTSALDVSVQKQVLDHLSELVSTSGTSMLFITHDLAVAADRAERIVVLKEGRVVEDGRVGTVLDDPRHDYTKALLDAAPFLNDGRDRNSPQILPVPADAGVLLKVRDLQKSFKSRDGQAIVAVGGVDLNVMQGETVCVVGESGSGKTTLARSILKLNEPETGSIVFNGYDVSSLKKASLKRYRREAQMVYQNPFSSLDLRYTVEAILREPLAVHGIGTRTEQTAEARRMLDLVGLPESFLRRRPSELSGGQRQRVAIARALITSPRLLVLDEAVSALDVSVQARILELLKSIQRDRRLAYLFITHDLSVAKSFADRVYVMKTGQVLESGQASSILEDPQHEYTRLLVKSAPGKMAHEKRETALSNRAQPLIAMGQQVVLSR